MRFLPAILSRFAEAYPLVQVEVHCDTSLNLLARNDLDPLLVDDCIVGAGSNEGAQGHNIGRNVAVLSGLGIQVPGMTLNRYCSSGLQAIAIAANQIASGCSEVIVAGGVSPANLRSHIELWDRLLQEFIAYLRDYSRLAAEQQGMAQDAGQPVDGEA